MRLNRTAYLKNPQEYPKTACDFPCILITIDDGELVSQDITIFDEEDIKICQYMTLDRHFAQVKHLLYYDMQGRVELDGAILIKPREVIK